MKQRHRRLAIAILVLAGFLTALFDPALAIGSPPTHSSLPVEPIHVPLVLRNWPPLPQTPVLLPIHNPESGRDYDVSWDPALLAKTYELEERWEEEAWVVVYGGDSTHKEIRSRPAGAFVYRVRSCNDWGCSCWSPSQSTSVAGETPGTISRPGSRSYDAAGLAVVETVNDCPYALDLEFAGPQPGLHSLPRCEACRVYSYIGPIFCPTAGRPAGEIRLAPGAYRVYASVDAGDVRPYVGHWELEGDRRYFLCFYIVRR